MSGPSSAKRRLAPMLTVALSVALSPSLSVIVEDAVSVIAPSARLASWSANGAARSGSPRPRWSIWLILGQRHDAGRHRPTRRTPPTHRSREPAPSAVEPTITPPTLYRLIATPWLVRPDTPVAGGQRERQARGRPRHRRRWRRSARTCRRSCRSRSTPLVDPRPRCRRRPWSATRRPRPAALAVTSIAGPSSSKRMIEPRSTDGDIGVAVIVGRGDVDAEHAGGQPAAVLVVRARCRMLDRKELGQRRPRRSPASIDDGERDRAAGTSPTRPSITPPIVDQHDRFVGGRQQAAPRRRPAR